HNPIARTVMDAAAAVIGAPYVGNRMLSGVIGMQTPYLNFELQSLQAARGGLVGNARGFQSDLLNMGKSGFVPGNGLGGLASQFGLNPKDVFNQVLNQYGVPVTGADSPGRVAASVRQAYLAPGI